MRRLSKGHWGSNLTTRKRKKAEAEAGEKEQARPGKDACIDHVTYME